MKKLTIIVSFVLFFSFLSIDAMAVSGSLPPLDKISLQLSAEQWATSNTAKVMVGINATLNNDQLGTIQSQIMNNLQKIANNVDWHITEFSRSKNQSGLEQLYVQAEARIPESGLVNLRKNATTVSKPGATYSIAAIDFSPSSVEIENVKASLRQEIYNEAQAELQRLNKIYPDEKFHLHTINFINPEPVPMPQMRTMLIAETNGNAASAPAAMVVSNKIKLTANVVLASNYVLQS